MNEIDVKDVINANYRICTLMGMILGFMTDIKMLFPKSEHHKYDWIIHAVNEVMYKNNPIPPFSERDHG